ncbi:MAG TPA: transposase [Patescibacteria group bacterium]|nr:transposase [Patescibacteria group bacterium]
MKRAVGLVTGEVYHIFNRSIVDYRIFNNDEEYFRMMNLLKYYQIRSEIKFSEFIQLKQIEGYGFDRFFEIISKDKEKVVQIIAYCLMPTHFHLILKQLAEKGISSYMANTLNSYTHYFNMKHRRKGPLWESKFKNVLVNNDEQLIHLTRYIHLNPATALLTEKPEQWSFSSYNKYLSTSCSTSTLCQYSDILDIKTSEYKKFVNDRVSYQRELAKIKNLLLD